MSEHVVTLLTTLGAMISALLAAYKAYKVGAQVNEIKITMNGRMDEIVALARAEAVARGHAKGFEEGIAAGASNSAAIATAVAEGVTKGGAPSPPTTP